MEVKISKREGRRISDFSALNGKLQHVFLNIRPFAYTEGLYGLDCEYYELPTGRIVCMGNRPIKAREIPVKLCKEYDDKAREIICYGELGHNSPEMAELLRDFCDELEKLV